MNYLSMAAVVGLISGAMLGWALSQCLGWRITYAAGHRAGRNEERSHTNALVGRAKLESYNRGVTDTRRTHRLDIPPRVVRP